MKGRTPYLKLKTKMPMTKTLSKKYLIGLATLAVVAGSALLASAVMASEIDQDQSCPSPLHMGRMSDGSGPRAEVQAAIEADDYEAFLELIAESPWVDRVDEEIFNILVEAHALREAGDIEGARALLDESDLPRDGPHHRYGHAFHSNSNE